MARSPNTRRLGLDEEEAAEDHLHQAGYVVVDRNVRSGPFEIDRIAWDGTTLCFVEVRSRASERHGRPEETVDAKKQHRLVVAARCYLAKNFRRVPPVRFDVIAVVGRGNDREIRLIRDAFRAQC